MKEFVFEVPVTAVVRVRAANFVAGLKRLKALRVSATGSKLEVTEVFASPERAQCVSVGGRDIEDPVCAKCDQPLKLIGGQWLDEYNDEEHPEICPDGGQHEPWEQFRCSNCGHEDREDEFIPSDGRDDEYCCPKCESTLVSRT